MPGWESKLLVNWKIKLYASNRTHSRCVLLLVEIWDTLKTVNFKKDCSLWTFETNHQKNLFPLFKLVDVENYAANVLTKFQNESTFRYTICTHN